MKKFLASFQYAVNGIISAFRGERNLKIQSACALVAIFMGYYFQITSAEWLAIIIMIILVLALEFINTAIENVVDLVSPEIKPLAGKIKDVAAGAVLVAAMGSMIIGIFIFWKYVI